MIKFFHTFIIYFLLLRSSHTCDGHVIGPSILDKIRYKLEEPQLKEENILTILKRNLEEYQSPKEVMKQGSGPFGHMGELTSPFTSFSRNFQKYPVPEDGVVKADPSQEISFSEYNDKYFPVTEWIGKIVDVSSKKLRRNGKLRKKRFRERHHPGSGKMKRYLDYTNSQMPFNEGQKLQQRKKAKTSQFSDKAWQDDEICMKDQENRFDLELKHKRLGRRLPFRSQEKNFEMLQDGSNFEYSRVRRYLDHERAKKRPGMTSTLEAKEAAMSRVLDPNLNSDGILEPHVRKRRGSRKESWV